jgi:hypothetical protein
LGEVFWWEEEGRRNWGGNDNVQHVLWSNDETPARPDGAGGDESGVLSEGEFVCWAQEVACAGEDDAPFHHGCPVVAHICQSYFPV